MPRCEQIRPLLFRVAEGEAAPAEAISVARHTPTCTGCRILLARESRLAQLLETDLDDLDIEENFVESVMATLPERPPARRSAYGNGSHGRNKKKKRRGLRLAALAGAVLSTLAMVERGFVFPGTARDVVSGPRLSAEWLEGVAGSLLGLAKAVLMAVDTLAARIPVILPALSRGPDLALAAALAALVVLVLASLALAVATGCWVRSSRARGVPVSV